MNIAIFGLGYVGVTAAGCLSKDGHRVTGVDVSAAKVAEINAGRSPITEPGLPELIAEGARTGLITATHDVALAVEAADIAIVCVGTPSGPDGAHNMEHIADVSRQIAASLSSLKQKRLTVIYRSTMRPGSINEIVVPIFESILGEQGLERAEIVYNPEFLREASAIHDYFHPPKIVIGTADGQPSPRMMALYAGIDAPSFVTSYGEAEITKFVDNTWHAVKVAFANEIGRISVRLGISPQKVYEIFVSDTKLNVSPYYLRPGGAFGGSCLPKDVRALQHLAGDLGVGASLIDSLLRSNEAHKRFAFELSEQGLPARSRVLVVGLAFKAKSDDLRESPNVDLVGKLLRAGHTVDVYDPFIDPKRIVGQNLGYAYVYLPNVADLLVDKADAETRSYDLVIDLNGQARTLKLLATRLLDVHTMTGHSNIQPEERQSDVGPRARPRHVA
ncbi:MAG: nucleotide sugar dehydrogenase [Devosia sp.]